MPRPPRPAARGRAVLGLQHLEDRTTPVAFGPPTDFAGVGSLAVSVASGDLDGDGDTDLVAGAVGGGVTPLLNDGTGQFAAGVAVPVTGPIGAVSVALADVGGSTALDLVVADGNSKVLVAVGNGDGTFAAPTGQAFARPPSDLAVADLNRDGKADLAVATGPGFQLLLNPGSGDVSTWAATEYLPGVGVGQVAAGDFDADGQADLAVYDPNGLQLLVLFGNGDGTFASNPVGIPTGFEAVYNLSAGDLNGDGRSDLVFSYINTGDVGVAVAGPGRTFAAPVDYSASGSAVGGRPVVADLDGDRKADVAVALRNGTQVAVLLGDGAGALGTAQRFTVGANPYDLVVADLDGDRRPDLAAPRAVDPGAVAVARNSTPVVPGGLTVVSGGDQSIAVGTPFTDPIVFQLTDQFGSPIVGEDVTVSVSTAVGGATGTITSGVTATTDQDGLASVLVDANIRTGTYTLTAAFGTLTADTTLTNLPGAVAAVQVVSGGGQTATVNGPFANPLRARVVDSFGNGVPNVDVLFRSPAAPAAGAVFPNGELLPNEDTAATGSDGVAVAPVRANVAAGSYTVTATVAGVFGQATFALSNVPGAPAVVQVLAGDGLTATVGTAFGTPPAPPIRVKVTDAFGNGLSDVEVTFLAPASGPSVVFGPGGNTATTGADGTAGIAVDADTVAGSYTVTATADGVVADGSIGLTNTAAAPALVTLVSGNNQSAVVNDPFGAPLVVKVTDRFGNPTPGKTVRFESDHPAGAPGAAFLSGPATDVKIDSAGLAPASPQANIVAGEYEVTAKVVEGPTLAGVSFALANTPGPAFQAEADSGAGQTTAVGTDFANQLVVKVTDRFGNGVPGVAVTFAGPAAGPGVTFPGRGGAVATTGADGRAGVTVRANNRSGSFAVQATAAGIAAPVSFLLTSTPGAAVGVAAVSGGGQRARVGTAFPDPLVVAAVDQFGNRVPGTQIALADAGGATFAGPTAKATGADGTASFPAGASQAAGAYAVVFTAPSLPGSEARFGLENTAGDVRGLVLVSGGGQSAAAGDPFAAPLVVRAVDEFGNPVPGVVIGFTVPAAGATAAFPGATTTGADGTVGVTPTAGTVAGSYAVGIAAPLAGGVPGLAAGLTNAAGPAATAAAVGGNGQAAETNTAYAQPLVVLVTDRFGNPVPGVVVSRDAAAGTGAGVAVNPASQATGADGRAAFAATANGVAGGHEVRFTVPGAGSVAFTLTNTAPPTGLLGSDAVAVGTGPGVPAQVRLLDGTGKETGRFDPFPGFTGGVRVAAADFNGDGIADVAAGAGPGGNRVRVYDGKTGNDLFDVRPFEAGYAGGVFVAAGDIDGDGAAELVVTPDQGGGPRVLVMAGRDFRLMASLLGIDDRNFRGGARAALGDFNKDGKADLAVAAGAGGGPRLAAYDGASVAAGQPVKLFNDVFVFEQRLRDGVYVAVGDVDGDGVAELIAGGGPGGGPRVLVLSGADLLGGNGPPRFVANFFAGSQEDRGGVRVAVKDLDGDDRADLVVGAADRVIGYAGKTITSVGAPPEVFNLAATLGVFVG